MKPPIIVNDNGDLLIFESTSSAEQYLEPDIIGANENEIYDSEGHRLNISVVKERSWFLFVPIRRERLVLNEAIGEARNVAQLRKLLGKFLAQVSEGEESLERCTLEQLIQKAIKFKVR